MLYVGMDIHKNYSSVAVIDEQGQLWSNTYLKAQTSCLTETRDFTKNLDF